MTGTTQSERHHGKGETFCGSGSLFSTFNTPLYYRCTPKRERPACCSTPADYGISKGESSHWGVSLCTCTNHLSCCGSLPAPPAIVSSWCWTGAMLSTPNRCMIHAAKTPLSEHSKARNLLPLTIYLVSFLSFNHPPTHSKTSRTNHCSITRWHNIKPPAACFNPNC